MATVHIKIAAALTLLLWAKSSKNRKSNTFAYWLNCSKFLFPYLLSVLHKYLKHTTNEVNLFDFSVVNVCDCCSQPGAVLCLRSKYQCNANVLFSKWTLYLLHSNAFRYFKWSPSVPSFLYPWVLIYLCISNNAVHGNDSVLVLFAKQAVCPSVSPHAGSRTLFPVKSAALHWAMMFIPV